MRSNHLSYGPKVIARFRAQKDSLPVRRNLSTGVSQWVTWACGTMEGMSYRATARSRSSRPEVLVVDGLVLQVTRKAIKNMYLRIKPPQGDIVVSAPLQMTDGQIERFARERRSWILAQQQRIREARQRLADTAADGASRGGEPVGFIHDAASWWTPERRERAASAIDARLPALVEHWSAVIGKRPTHITLRAMTTRWGSCTPRTGRIRLNLQLGLLPPQYLEYVLVHEMTHLWASGHGAEFQRRMTQYLPDWRRLRRELNRYTTG